jgi:hypothetical protein
LSELGSLQAFGMVGRVPFRSDCLLLAAVLGHQQGRGPWPLGRLALLRTSDGVPVYNAAGLLADLRVRLEDYWWLGFMLFSTLLPTLAHLAIGAFALFTLASGWLGRPIAAGLMKGDSPEGRAASLALTLTAALAVWLPCLLLWLALSYGGGWLLDGLLDCCERFLGLLEVAFPHPPAP